MAIEFESVSNFVLAEHDRYKEWLFSVVQNEGFSIGELNYIFCDDEYLLGINKQYLDHDTFTDIITFDYTEGKVVSGDVFISTERVAENAVLFHQDFNTELLRVIAHGVLHLMGYKDKEDADVVLMRAKEEEKIKMFHVEQ